jgi:class 3 adenylate cyclase
MDISEKILFCTDEILMDCLRKVNSLELVCLISSNVINEYAQKCIYRLMSIRAQEILKKDIEYYNNDIEDVNNLKNKFEIYLNESINMYPESKNENAILFTDLVNSTEKINLLGDDEYYEKILTKHNAILSESINKYNGRIIKTIGDAYLAIFYKELDAIRSCIYAQNMFNAINVDRDKNYHIVVRMAVHLGKFYLKVTENIVDVYGSEINYAARMVGFTGGNQISVSKKFINNWPNTQDIINSNNERIKELEKDIKEQEEEKVPNIDETKNILDLYKKNASEVIELCTKIKFNSLGFFSFKGFDNDQELYGVNL